MPLQKNGNALVMRRAKLVSASECCCKSAACCLPERCTLETDVDFTGTEYEGGPFQTPPGWVQMGALVAEFPNIIHYIHVIPDTEPCDDQSQYYADLVAAVAAWSDALGLPNGAIAFSSVSPQAASCPNGLSQSACEERGGTFFPDKTCETAQCGPCCCTDGLYTDTATTKEFCEGCGTTYTCINFDTGESRAASSCDECDFMVGEFCDIYEAGLCGTWYPVCESSGPAYIIEFITGGGSAAYYHGPNGVCSCTVVPATEPCCLSGRGRLATTGWFSTPEECQAAYDAAAPNYPGAAGRGCFSVCINAPSTSAAMSLTAKPQTLEDQDPTGPGTFLSKTLEKIGIKASPTCSCKARARTMNEKGNDWCEENLDTIVGWLREEATKRKLPFVDFAGKLLVTRAIKLSRAALAKAEQQCDAPDTPPLDSDSQAGAG